MSENVKKCRNCGFANAAAMNFCLECGTPLEGVSFSSAVTENFSAARQQSVPTLEAPKKKSRKSLWIFGGLISLLILASLGAVGVWFAASKLARENTAIKTSSPKSSASKKSTPTQEKPTETDLANDSPTPPPEEESPAPDPNFTPPKTPTAQGDFNVKADASGWQLSNLDTIPNENFFLLASGNVKLRESEKEISAEGIDDKKYQARRLYAEYPFGALLMRTRYANGKFSKISMVSDKRATGIWRNAPDERGRLEFCINDNAPDGNDGELVVSLTAIN